MKLIEILEQGVGFRPTVRQLARELGLSGEVRDDVAWLTICSASTGEIRRPFPRVVDGGADRSLP